MQFDGRHALWRTAYTHPQLQTLAGFPARLADFSPLVLTSRHADPTTPHHRAGAPSAPVAAQPGLDTVQRFQPYVEALAAQAAEAAVVAASAPKPGRRRRPVKKADAPAPAAISSSEAA
jgi:hypothetical protein